MREGVPDDLRPWSQRQWTGAVVMLFVAQVVLLAVVAERTPVPRVASGFPGGMAAVHWPDNLSDPARDLGVRDPTLFAQPHDSGFSGVAWRMASVAASPRLEWREPVRWLAGRTNWFGVGLQGPGIGLPTPRVIADVRMPAETKVTVRPLPILGKSKIELDAALLARGIVSHPVVPVLTHTNLLEATRLQVAVEPDGRVFSAVVLGSSGWEVADHRALALLGLVQFSPRTDLLAPTNEREWGTVTVRWACQTSPQADPSAPIEGGT